ncbi:hypothetical protein B0H17DRAFT_1210774 [Mycena rosella]|uniref:Uncharacterized protein n=1 Tax=Mycena rosella TaxID=1033263 RepID=A0AAD7CW28_MYCRO|nr:hypothetical protein B0H17DRAFT_1210774 [Mycena rosella]
MSSLDNPLSRSPYERAHDSRPLFPSSSNPWNTDSSDSTSTSASSSSIFENPWGAFSRSNEREPLVDSPRSIAPRAASSTATPTQQRADPIPQRALPADPTVAPPAKQRSMSTGPLESGLSAMTLDIVRARTREHTVAADPPKARRAPKISDTGSICGCKKNRRGTNPAVSASSTSTNNYINFCALTLPQTPLTNGLQITTGSCNPAPIGLIPSR